MPITQKNKLQIAYKKLLGKAQTNIGFIPSQEIPTAFQAASSFIFGETIPGDETEAESSSIVKKVPLSLIPLGQYKASPQDDTGDDLQGLGFHSFALALKEEISINDIQYQPGALLKDNVKLQIVPDVFGNFYYPSFFKGETPVSSLSAIDWFVDPFSGILWIQDLTSEFDGTENTAIQSEIHAYLYTGKFVDEKIQEGGSGVGSPSDDLIIENSDPDSDEVAGTVSIIFEDVPGSDPQPDRKAAISYFEGQLDFYTDALNKENIIMNLSGSVLSASSIRPYGPEGSLQFHNSQNLISGSEGLIWNEAESFLTASNLYTNIITSSFIKTTELTASFAEINDLTSSFIRTTELTASFAEINDLTSSNSLLSNIKSDSIDSVSIFGYGIQNSVQFKNNQNLISGSENFTWDEDTKTLTVKDGTIAAETISVNGGINTTNITVTDKTTLAAAGGNTQIQFNKNGYLSAAANFVVDETAKALKVTENNNYSSLYVDSESSGIKISNSVSSQPKLFTLNKTTDDSKSIYKANSDLPLYINSQTQNKITAGTSKIDMSAGKVEIWPDSNNYFKLTTSTDTISTTLNKFKLGINSDDSKYCLFKYTESDETLKLFFSNEDEDTETFKLSNSGLLIPKYFAVGTESSNGFTSFYYNSQNSGQRTTINLANISNLAGEYANIKYERQNSEGVLSFAVESTTPQMEIKKDGVYIGGALIDKNPSTYLLENDVTKYYDSEISFVDRTTIFKQEVKTNTRYSVEVTLYFSYQNGKIQLYYGDGAKVMDSHTPLLFDMPTLKLEIEDPNNSFTALSTSAIFNSYTLFENKANTYMYYSNLPLLDGPTLDTGEQIYYTPFRQQSLTINKITALTSNETVNIGLDRTTINDFIVFSCKFIIDLKQLVVNNGASLIESLYGDSRLTSLEGTATTVDVFTSPPVNLCVSAYSSQPTTSGDETVIRNNLDYNFTSVGALEYIGHKSGFCIYQGSHITIASID